MRYEKVVAKSRALLPTVPDKKDLRPYPTLEGLVFKGHRSIIRTISIHPSGKYLASGSDDHTVRGMFFFDLMIFSVSLSAKNQSKYIKIEKGRMKIIYD